MSLLSVRSFPSGISIAVGGSFDLGESFLLIFQSLPEINPPSSASLHLCTYLSILFAKTSEYLEPSSSSTSSNSFIELGSFLFLRTLLLSYKCSRSLFAVSTILTLSKDSCIKPLSLFKNFLLLCPMASSYRLFATAVWSLMSAF